MFVFKKKKKKKTYFFVRSFLATAWFSWFVFAAGWKKNNVLSTFLVQ